MPSYVTAEVTGVISQRAGLVRVDTDAGRACALTSLTGPVAVGDRVVLNTTAVDLGLGTGGWHLVHWNLARDSWSAPGGGHIMKLRYTSLQVDTGAAEEAHPDLHGDLGGMPVVACGLHSQLPCVAAALLVARPGTRIAYVMTDGAALPLALSDLVAAMREARMLTATITAGHAFGGDLEAVAVPSALALARSVLDAEVCIVAMGPGVVGTGSDLGTTATEAAWTLDATAALAGRPVLCVRASSADLRDRHRGVSHHTATAMRLASVPADVPAPPALAGDLARLPGRHRVVTVAAADVAAALALHGLEVTTMGRGPGEDPLFFEAAAAAGTHVAGLLDLPEEQ
jgi:hypothetical protein